MLKKNSKKNRVFVAMSGGVDSSVAAALLQKEGYEVVGVFMKGWQAPNIECTWKEDRRDAMRAAATLGIPFLTFDFSHYFYENVVRYLLSEYGNNRTPNPDVMCNKAVKFGFFLKRARELGADYIATGHYVRLRQKMKSKNTKIKIRVLSTALDLNKDQSYFLWTLTQEQLQYCLFPIGTYHKSEVRKLARAFGLPNADKKDSQGVCFIGKLDMSDFLKQHIPERKGPVVTTGGDVVGQPKGLHLFTIGQRRGIGISGADPYYVAKKDPVTNTLIVADGTRDPLLYKNKFRVGGMHWIYGVAPKMPLKCLARIRYRQPLEEATVIGAGDDSYEVAFIKPQFAVAKGQSIVFYRNSNAARGCAEMLGGAVI